jgi:hypothetical protein
VGEHHALGLALRLFAHRAHDRIGGVRRPVHQRLAIGRDIDGQARDLGFDRGARHRRGHPPQHARIKRLGDEVLGAILDGLAAVGRHHAVRHRLARQLGERAGRRRLHRLAHRAGSNVEGAAEDIGEAEHVVDLVGEVRPTGRHQRVGAGLHRVGIGDLGIGVGEREDDRTLGHGLEHRRGHHVGDREAHEHIGAHHRVGEGPPPIVGAREALFVAIEIGAAAVDDALGVDQGDVIAVEAQADEELDAGDGPGAGARDHQLDGGERLAGEIRGVEQPGAGDDRGAVLVIVEHRDAHPLAQLFFDLEAGGGGDVLEVDAAERRLQGSHEVHELVDVGLRDLEIEDVDIGELLEEAGLALHHRLARGGADVAQAEHGGAVGDDGDEVGASGVFPALFRIGGDLEAGLRDTGRIGE